MKSIRGYIFCLTILTGMFTVRPGMSQMFKPQINISLGAGVNVPYFDVGGGTPGLSLTSSTMYHWAEHWRAGILFGAHHVMGTDEGTPDLGRALAFNSYMYEFSGNVEYLFYYASSWKRKWKQKINPTLPYGGTWKRKIKPYLTAGGGILHYKPYVYYYPNSAMLDENPPLSDIGAVLNGGFGLYFFINRYVSFKLDAKVNFPLFDYFDFVDTEEIEDKLDILPVITLSIMWSTSVS